MKTHRWIIGLLALAATLAPSRPAEAATAWNTFIPTWGMLHNGDYLVSPGQKYFAILQGDGNLVVYDGYKPLTGTGLVVWNSKTWGHTAPQFAILQGDGNFVLYAGSDGDHQTGVLWAAASNGGNGQSILMLDDTGSLGVYTGTDATHTTAKRWSTPPYASPAPPAPAAPAVPAAYLLSLQSGQYLAMNQYLLSTSKRFFLIQQADGNLVQNRGSGPGDLWGTWWSSGATAGTGTYFTALLENGRLCTYKGTDPAHNLGNIWCIGNPGPTGPYYLTVQTDGNLVVYKGTPSNSQGYLWGTQKIATMGEAMGRARVPTTFTNGQLIAFESPSVDCYNHQPGPGVAFGLNGGEYSGSRTLQTLQSSDLLSVEIVPPAASDPPFYTSGTYQKLKLRTSSGAYLKYESSALYLVQATGTQATADVFVVYTRAPGTGLGVRLYSANAAPWDVFLDAYGSLCSGNDFGPSGAHAPALYNGALNGGNTPGQRFNILMQ